MRMVEVPHVTDAADSGDEEDISSTPPATPISKDQAMSPPRAAAATAAAPAAAATSLQSAGGSDDDDEDEDGDVPPEQDDVDDVDLHADKGAQVPVRAYLGVDSAIKDAVGASVDLIDGLYAFDEASQTFKISYSETGLVSGGLLNPIPRP